LVKTASGALLGPLLRAEPLEIYIEAVGLFATVNQELGTVAWCSSNFASADCTGTPYIQMGVVGPNGVCESFDGRLFRVSNPPLYNFFPASNLGSNGACSQRDPKIFYLMSGYPMLEVVDPRYPYDAPLQIVFE
jgi:hypothetical protein